MNTAYEVDSCVSSIRNNASYQSILEHKQLDNRIPPTMKQLADETIPTDEEVQILIAIHNDIAPCRAKAIENLSSIIPAMILVAIQSYKENDLMFADLIQRKVTWGEYNKRSLEFKKEMMGKMQSAHAQEQALIDRIEAENREKILSGAIDILGVTLKIVANGLSAWSAQQQALFSNLSPRYNYGYTRPVTIDCIVKDSIDMISCTSR